jgi:hypothetical protein
MAQPFGRTPLDRPRLDRPQFDEDKARKYLAYSRWVWLVGSVVSIISAVVGAVSIGDPSIVTVLLVISCVEAAIAVPAALALRKRANWARITLFVLALLSLASLYQAFKMQAWPTVIFNLILGSTMGTLSDKNVKAACKTSTRPAAQES